MLLFDKTDSSATHLQPYHGLRAFGPFTKDKPIIKLGLLARNWAWLLLSRAVLFHLIDEGCGVATEVKSAKDWLIFKSGPSEVGVHPTHAEWEGQTYDHPRHHLIALMCDDIDTTVGELRAKGAQFRGPIEQREYGRVIMMIAPGADDIQLYQPTHKLAYNL